jgi:flagellin-like protein
MERLQAYNRKQRAVSPVIGVILMVAITVILAAVIGAFVLQIGDQGATAPRTSFETAQTTVFYQTPRGSANNTVVDVEHIGGDTITYDELELRVNGNSSVWGEEEDGWQYGGGRMKYTGDPSTTHFTASMCLKNTNCGYIPVEPAPDLRETLGTNEPTELTAGESMDIVYYQYINDELVDVTKTASGYGEADYYVDTPKGGVSLLREWGVAHSVNAPNINTSDRVTVVWESSSGKKTQTLFEYTVQ